MEPRNYETVFVLTPVLSEEQVQKSIDKFRNLLQEKKAEIVHEQKLGLKQLAYPIQHKSTGTYHLFEFKATPDTVSALETAYRRDETIMRFLTLALDKHAVAYNTQQRSSAVAKNTKQKEVVA